MFVTLQFINTDCCTINRHKVLHLDRAVVDDVVMWYAEFHAGDDFTVMIDDETQVLDHNGYLK